MPMTEAEWLAATEPYRLTHYKACRSPRKRRLLACAFARRVLDLVPDDRYAAAIAVAEAFADGLASEDEIRATRRALTRLWGNRQFGEAGNYAATAALATLHKEAVGAVHALDVAAAARAAESRPDWNAGLDAETREQCLLARHVFGNPFQPRPALDPACLTWQGGTVEKLARAAYEERSLPAGTLELQRLALLADSLEDAGCDRAELLTHLRSPGPHVRGCWALDKILGKE
jgi:hypothetical protein